MRRNFIFFLLTVMAFPVFAQRLPTVAILPIEAGNRVTADEAASITNQIVIELSSWGTLNIVRDAAGAEYVVKGSLGWMANSLTLTADTIEVRNNKKLNESKEQVSSFRDLPVVAFCSKIVESVPFPNYMLGTWQSTINMPDGPVVCIMEFRSDRTIRVDRYDTWEHRQRNSLRYEGYGTGTYSYAGYYNKRNMKIGSQSLQVDAITGINLKLEETLPEQTNVNQGRLGVVFNADKTAFDLVGGVLPCGRNYDGPSVYPSASIGFSRFVKIK
jgi:hypothetical protein